MKQNTSSVVGFTTQVTPFITAAAMKISRPYSKQLAGKLPSTAVIKFPRQVTV